MVELVAYLLKMYFHWVLPFSHIMALMVLSLFLLNKTRLFIDIFLSSFVILLTLIGSKATRPWICRIYLCAAAIPFSHNVLMPCFNIYVFRNQKSCKSYIPDREVFMCSIVIAMICAVSEIYYSVWYAFAGKCCQICGVTMTLLVRRLPWLSSSSTSLSYASSDMNSSSSGS